MTGSQQSQTWKKGRVGRQARKGLRSLCSYSLHTKLFPEPSSWHTILVLSYKWDLHGLTSSQGLCCLHTLALRARLLALESREVKPHANRTKHELFSDAPWCTGLHINSEHAIVIKQLAEISSHMATIHFWFGLVCQEKVKIFSLNKRPKYGTCIIICKLCMGSLDLPILFRFYLHPLPQSLPFPSHYTSLPQ